MMALYANKAPIGSSADFKCVTDVQLRASNSGMPPSGPAGYTRIGNWDVDGGGSKGTDGSTGHWMMALYTNKASTNKASRCVEKETRIDNNTMTMCPAGTVMVGIAGGFGHSSAYNKPHRIRCCPPSDVLATGANSPVKNVALNKATKQSSQGWGGEPKRAVDGNTSGNYGHKSVTHTQAKKESWWQVDLAGVYDIETINVYNRTDCCGERLSNFYVMVSDTPFPADLNSAKNQANWNQHVADQAKQKESFTVGTKGRYVQVQLAGSNNLSLAEVEVMGRVAKKPVSFCTETEKANKDLQAKLAAAEKTQKEAEVKLAAEKKAREEALAKLAAAVKAQKEAEAKLLAETTAYLGCFKDQGAVGGTKGRDLNGLLWSDRQMTTEKCLQHCQSKGYDYAGTQNTAQCFCGNTYGRSGTANNCDRPCEGNADQICGGRWANSVYDLAQLNEGLVAYYPFDGIQNASGHGNLGTNIDQFKTNDFTVAFWFRTQEKSRLFDLAGDRTAGSHGNFFAIRMTGKHESVPEGTVSVEIDQDSRGTNYIGVKSTTAGLNDGNWRHIAAIREGKSLALYIDGKLESTGKAAGIANIENHNDFRLGRSYVGFPNAVVQYDNFRVYNDALTGNRIKAIFVKDRP
jgi:hypothetical protein